MKIRRLELENFRQFYGEQELRFSTDERKNVTLIYGSNGSGKTTILNALTWGLYGTTTPGLADAEWLHNNRAWRGVKESGELTCRVRIEFEDDEKVYELERHKTVRRTAESSAAVVSSDATLHITDEAGRSELGNPAGAVNAILPERLHRFVFFDGERAIQHLARPEAVPEIEDAIKTVLGLGGIERAIEHLNLARRELNRELSSVGDSRDEELDQKIVELTETIDGYADERTLTRDNLTAREAELEKIDAELARLEASKELQERRTEAERAVAAADKRILQADTDLDEAARRSGFLAFVPPLLQSCDGLVTEKHHDGEIPSAIKQHFVQHLIDEQQCICGTALPEGSPEHQAVADWFAKAGRNEVEDRWISMRAHIKSYWTRRDDLYRFLKGTLDELEGHRRDHKQWTERLTDIDEEVKELDSDAVRDLESKRDQLKAEIRADERKIGSLDTKSDEASQRRKEAQDELASARAESEKAALARRRVKVAQEAQDAFCRILEIRTEATRAELDAQIKSACKGILGDAFTPELSSDYELNLFERRDGGDPVPVAKSTGETQLLSLSFVSALASKAREQFEKAQRRSRSGTAGLLSYHGGIFPLVLDAPFGQLDDDYQERVSRQLPTLASQVVVLVSRGQAAGAVRDELYPRAGRVAVCTQYRPGVDEAEVETPNGKHPYRVAVDESEERTEIVEVL